MQSQNAEEVKIRMKITQIVDQADKPENTMYCVEFTKKKGDLIDFNRVYSVIIGEALSFAFETI